MKEEAQMRQNEINTLNAEKAAAAEKNREKKAKLKEI